MLSSLLPLACPGCGRPGPVCAVCASTLAPASPSPPPPGIDRWYAPFAYAGVVREVLARLKYRGAHAAVDWVADAMVATLAPPLPTVVTWAPTTPSRRRERGFDHAELLARAVARRLGRRCRGLLTRGSGPPQTGLDRSARLAGPAFRARGRVPGSVLVVDDIATTGATLSAAALALRSEGELTVVAIVAALTPDPGRAVS
ncbi:MAG TPA: ComF family protein [Acidimicrobiia bacterium]|nr:ComF family protein [Acidimicrobiia bacterium]